MHIGQKEVHLCNHMNSDRRRRGFTEVNNSVKMQTVFNSTISSPDFYWRAHTEARRTCSYQEQKQKTQNPSLRKSVSFTDVNIREYERILGDNPSCSSGAPISLGWKYSSGKSLPVDDFELIRSFQRGAGPRCIPWHDRKDVLLEWGATFSEISNAVRQTMKAKHNRRRTVNSIGRYDRFEEALEGATQKLKRALSFENKKNPDRPYFGYRRTRRGSEDLSGGSSISPGSSNSISPSISTRNEIDSEVFIEPEKHPLGTLDSPCRNSVVNADSVCSTVGVTPSASSKEETVFRGDMGPHILSLDKQDKPIVKPRRLPSLTHYSESIAPAADDVDISSFAVSETNFDAGSSFSTFTTREGNSVQMSTFDSFDKEEDMDCGMTFAAPTSKLDETLGLSRAHGTTGGNIVERGVSNDAMGYRNHGAKASDPEEEEASIPSQFLKLLGDGSVTSVCESQSDLGLLSASTSGPIRPHKHDSPMVNQFSRPVGLGELAEC